jgi:SNF2 family DNA or RNA helicase
MLIMDEMHKLKNHRSQIHESVKELSMNCNRIYGLTATPIKNRLMEFFSLFRVIKSDLFPKISHFMNDYCVTKLQPIGGGRQVPIVVGYKNLQQFISKIEPYYFSKKKHEVAEQLPKLISREIPCELSDIQEELYDMAESGLLGKNTDITQAEMLQSLTLCQQAVNSPYLIKDENGNPFEGPSTKEETLIDLLENDLSEKKVIIFSRFEKMISRLENLLDEAKIKNVRITGKEHKAQDREKAKNKFQDPNSGMNVILITTAGSESINLQAAEYIIFFDSCWSFGDYIQLVGRAVRIGSRNDSVVAIHFVGEKQNGEKTIDQHVLNILRKKKKLIDVVAGQNIPDALDFKSKNEMFELFSEMYSSSASEANSNKTNKRQEDKKKPKKKPKEDVLSVKSEDNCKISLVSLDASDI